MPPWNVFFRTFQTQFDNLNNTFIYLYFSCLQSCSFNINGHSIAVQSVMHCKFEEDPTWRHNVKIH